MASVKLSNGREVDINVAKMTVREFRDLYNPALPADRDDEIIAKVTGIPAEELKDLPVLDYRLVFLAIRDAVRNSQVDPT